MKSSTSLQILLNEHITKAAYIIDEQGKIVAFNPAGENYIPEITEEGDFFELLEDDASTPLQKMFSEDAGSNEISKRIIEINAGSSVSKFEITCLRLLSNDEKLFLITIEQLKEQVRRDGNKKFIFYTSEIEGIVEDDNIKKIINEIKSSYPFTFIGKTKFQKDIDNLEASFWIKDINGKFTIVNQKYANSLGLRVSQIEGQNEKDLVPKFMLKLNKTIDTYIVETSNSVLVERENPSSMNGKNEKVEIIEFPICDIDNNVVAIVGFSKNKIEENAVKGASSKMFTDVIRKIEEVCFVIDNDDIIKAVSQVFVKKIQGYNEETLVGKRVDDIFGLSFYNNISSFKSNKGQKEAVLEKFKDLKFGKESFNVILRKIEEEKSDQQSVLVIFKSSEEKLTKDFSDKMYEAIMQNSPEAMFVYDIENLRFLQVNNAALKLYGYQREQFLSMDLTDLYAPEDIQTLLESANTGMMSGDFTGPWKHRKSDGESILVELSKTTLEYKERKAHLNVVREVSEKLEKEKELMMFKASFENSGDIIINTDMDGFITFANEKAVKVLGYPKIELETRSFLSLILDDYRAEVSTNVFHSDEKSTIVKEIELKKENGERLDATIYATPIFNYQGDLDAFNVVINVKQKETIQHVQEVVQSEAKSGVLEASFLSNVFHELLTPINVILGFVREITDSIDNPTEDQNEASDIINENQKVLIQLMDNAIEYSTLVQGTATIKPEEILFTDLIDDLKSNVKKTGEEKNVEFAYGKISSSLKFESDRQKIISLLTLFIKFAIQLTEQQKIFLSAYLFGEDKCVISLRDERGEISEGLHNGLKFVLNSDENDVRKKYGFSRFTVKLCQELVKILNIKSEALLKNGSPVEYGLVVPLNYVSPENDDLELESEKTVEEPDEKKEEVKPQPVHIEPVSIEEPSEPKEEIVASVQPTEFSGEGVQKVHIADEKKEAEEVEKVEEKVPVEEPFEKVIEKPESMPKEETKTIVQESSSINVSVNLQQPEAFHQVAVPTPASFEVVPVEEPREKKKGLELSELSCLYVEDQVDSQILFKVQMKDLKAIEFATSFEKALPLLKSKNFDFIVMDINLQGEYNGLDALRIIQKMPGYENLPIIAVTAYVLPGDREKFIAAGFKDFISKPILREKLVDVLKSIF